MTNQPTATYKLVDGPEAMRAALPVIEDALRLGVDTEADSRHHYPEKVCLVQIAADETVFLVDPLAPIDLEVLRPVLADPATEKVLHGADFDLRGLNRDWGFEVRGIYDTNVAARFAGLERFGLAALIEDLLGMVIPKHQRLQRADWSKRPLADDAMEYAAGDVAHLGELRDALDERLGALGRREWVAEECERFEEIRYVPPDEETAFLSVRGSSRLSGRSLAVLKSLYEFREREARRLDRPTAFVIPAEAMIHLASNPNADLAEAPNIGKSTIRRIGPGIRRALQAGAEASPVARPASRLPFRARPSHAEAARLARLKAWRTKEGEGLALDPALLWPMRSLERLAREPSTFDAELGSTDVRRWQRALFADAVRVVLG